MKIICIGRNYIEHVRELNNKMPSEPVFFLKPDTALQIRNRPFYYPDFSKEIHYEVELVLKLSRTGKNIQPVFARSYVGFIGLGVDFTARDLQEELKAKGLPWEKAKAFDYSAPISDFIPVSDFDDLGNIDFSLYLNGHQVQQGNSNQMTFGFEAIISHISKYITLRSGDLIFTGTPSGVGPVQPGDHLEGYLAGKKMLDFRIK